MKVLEMIAFCFYTISLYFGYLGSAQSDLIFVDFNADIFIQSPVSEAQK